MSSTFYANATRYFYIENKSLISFCEVKNFTPFPELLFNFIGVVNELKPNLMKQIHFANNRHIATTLMISGRSNSHAERIIINLQSRYHLNILSDLFNIGGVTFGRHSSRRIRTI